MNKYLLQLRKVLLGRDGAQLNDGQLLERFIAARDEAAFEVLVRRHGPMVYRVCRHVVGDEHDAEDAFQATFLVLARKPETIVPRDAVGNWLCGVAFRTGQAARAARLRRRAHERQVFDLPHPAMPRSEEPDLLPLIDRELNRLPEKFRLPIILCGLEGRGRKEVAEQLCVPEGTLASRLDTARRMLAKRLARFGVAISAASSALAFPKDGMASPPQALISATVQTSFTAAPPAVAALASGVLRAAIWLRVKVAAAVLLAAALTALGGAGAWHALGSTPLASTESVQRITSRNVPRYKPPEESAVALRTPTDEERLQGVWNVILLERDGETKPLPEKTGRHLVFVKDDKVMTHFLRVPEGRGYVSVQVRLDTTTNPKTIEVLHGGGRLWEGIYTLEDDTIKVCVVPVGHKKPTTFTTAANAPPMLVVFKRDRSVVWDMDKWQKALDGQS